MDTDDIREMTDAQVVQWARTANDDCLEAANTEPNGEWHAACFAACVVLGQEMSRRGLRLSTLH